MCRTLTSNHFSLFFNFLLVIGVVVFPIAAAKLTLEVVIIANNFGVYWLQCLLQFVALLVCCFPSFFFTFYFAVDICFTLAPSAYVHLSVVVVVVVVKIVCAWEWLCASVCVFAYSRRDVRCLPLSIRFRLVHTSRSSMQSRIQREKIFKTIFSRFVFNSNDIFLLQFFSIKIESKFFYDIISLKCSTAPSFNNNANMFQFISIFYICNMSVAI